MKKRDVRIGNINAAKAVADAVRTSLGPRGMDKMVRLAAHCFKNCYLLILLLQVNTTLHRNFVNAAEIAVCRLLS